MRLDASDGGPSGAGLPARLVWVCVALAAGVAAIVLGAATWALARSPGPVPTAVGLALVCAAAASVAITAGAAVCVHRLARAHVRTTVGASPAAGQPVVGQQVEVFVGLARRLQGLVHREIQLLDVLEAQVEDPDLLKGLFQVDHLATRIRRYAENLAVVGGAVLRRQWSRPLPLVEVLRSAIAEVEQYARVRVVPPVEGTVRGHAGADVVHLLAELVENATAFAPPHTEVTVRARRVALGVAVEVDDRGLGMPHPEQDRVNALLADPGRVDVGDLLRDGRIGAWVVSALARRHGITVKLQSNVYGGLQAVVILPTPLLGDLAPGQPPAVEAGRMPPRGEPTGTATSSAPVAGASPSPVGARHHPPAPPPALTRVASSATAPALRDGAAVGQVPREAGPAGPLLPRRTRQAHLAAPLGRSRPGSVNQRAGDHDPMLMADFLRGASSGSGEPPAPRAVPRH
ncbi:Histidine kinase-, DNA gyrase B-, and HSP90-like ATPase [Micromonospora matsumotoense]|uniref:histidine kinase n=1 Tax=Micromonospora matsumotoense TaxID=121616 RepID=A0A1C5ABC5_9ACTN|nr:ATP-binding protein [Micromonospora matsumotoense]SCF42381.1 Histidine kinase-, DNA gyrase B-, and HSP90-like ATPase [Micromonospora matsumotoense]